MNISVRPPATININVTLGVQYVPCGRGVARVMQENGAFLANNSYICPINRYGTMLKIAKLTFNPIQENTYILWDESGECIVVDAGNLSAREDKVLAEFIEEQGLNPVMAVNTHCHFDHILGVEFVRST